MWGRLASFLPVFIFHLSLSFSQSFLPRDAVLISHLSADFSAANDEFVVLYNTLPDTARLYGYELRYFTSTGSSGSAGRVFPASASIPPFSHFLVASRETVVVGAATSIRDDSFGSGLAASGGQLLLRHISTPDSVVFAAAWGSISSFIEGMTEAAPWPGDGMISLSFESGAYVRTSYNSFNSEYSHTASASIVSIPSLNPFIPLAATDWRMRIMVSQGGTSDSSLTAGMAEGASDGFDTAFDLPKPPPSGGNEIYAAFWRPDLGLATGTNLLSEYTGTQSLASSSFGWSIFVSPPATGMPVRISLAIDSLPTSIPAIIRDELTGERKNLRSLGSFYEFTPTVTDDRFFRIFIGDTTPPIVAFTSPGEANVFIAGRVAELRWSIDDNSGIDSLWLGVMKRPGDTPQTVTVPLSDTGASWNTSTSLLSDSVRLTLVARDFMGNESVTLSPFFGVVPDTMSLDFVPGWHMVGFPLVPVDSSLGAIVPVSGADSGYLFSYAAGSGYGTAAAFEPGAGYFLGLLAPRTIRIAGVRQEDTTRTPLRSGFNIISGQSDSARVKREIGLQKDGVFYTYDDGLSAGLVASGLTTYDPSSQVYVSSDSLHPWKGYWLPVIQPDVSLVWGYRQSFSARVTAGSGWNWRVRFLVSASGATDSLASIGVASLATEGFDARFDTPAPPAPPRGSSVTTWFEHDTWPAVLGTSYVADIRDAGQSHTWMLHVRTPPGSDAKITWRTDSGTLPEELFFVDKAEGTTLSMRESGMYAFPSGGERTFALKSSPTPAGEETITLPNSFSVSQNYPNPFNGSTTIPFEVPVRARVKIWVVDVLGRTIDVIADAEFDPGVHTTFWSTGAPSGIYFIRMKPGNGVRRVAVLK